MTKGDATLQALKLLVPPSKMVLITGFISECDVVSARKDIPHINKHDLVAIVQKHPPNTGAFHTINFGDIRQHAKN